jgi:anti-sigma factor RsiW
VTSHLCARLSPLVDGQLDHDERDRALSHLAHCLRCRHEVIEYRQMKARLAGLGTPSLPTELADRLLRLTVAAPARQAAARPATGGFTTGRPVPARPAAGWVGVDPGPSGRAAGQLRVADIVAPRRWSPQPVRPGGRPRSGPPGYPQPAFATAPWGISPRLSIAASRARRRSRVRRTLIGSAAVMLLTVSGAALGDASRVPRLPGPAAAPTVSPVLPVSQTPSSGGSRRLTPLVTQVVLPSSRH